MMTKRTMFKALLLICVFAFQSVSAQKFLKTDGQKIIDPDGNNVILRGVGLGGHMLQEGYMMRVPFSGQQYVLKEHITDLIGAEKTAEFYEAWLANHTTKTDIDSLKKWGFNSVRLPMHYNLYTLPTEKEPVKGQHTWLEKGFQMTDSLLKWCADNRMYLILDMHATPGGQGNDLNISDRNPELPSLWESEANQDKLVALWKKLAERYVNEPWIGAYDIINEPNWGFDPSGHKNGLDEQKNEPLKALMVNITSAIREVDKNHIIIIEGNGWGNNYNGIFPLWDDNTVISFHKYWNYNTQEQIQHFLKMRETNNAPIWLGESGENSNVWFQEAISLMEENNIGWCWWPLKKLGSNNPLEIVVPEGYQKVLNYWAEKGPRPSAKEAYTAFMALAEAAKIENNKYHPDVVDAMIRQVKSSGTLPFKKVVLDSEGSIAAANYDLGKLNEAYFDTGYANYHISEGGKRTNWNEGRFYRNDGVDIFKGEDGHPYVGKMEATEWLQYTFEVTEAGKYHIDLIVKTDASDGAIQLLLNDADTFGLETDALKEWHVLSIPGAYLKKGANILRIKVQSGTFDFLKIDFKKNN